MVELSPRILASEEKVTTSYHLELNRNEAEIVLRCMTVCTTGSIIRREKC